MKIRYLKQLIRKAFKKDKKSKKTEAKSCKPAQKR